MSVDQTGQDSVLSSITQTISDMREGESVAVTGYYIVASFIDSNGVRSIFTDQMEDQITSESLGMLAFAKIKEELYLQDYFATEDCDEDEDDE